MTARIRGTRRDGATAAEGARGNRGRQTRQRMLDALAEQIRDRPLRDVKVADVAEAAGVTSAAFYQYFTGLDAAILVLAEGMAVEARELTDLMAGDWEGDGWAVATRVVDGFLDFWERHEPVVRVVELGIDQHDPQFHRVRMAMLSETTLALSFVLAQLKQTGVQPASVEPRAMAATLMAGLIHISSRLFLYEKWGLERDEMRRSMTEVLFCMVTRRPAPER